MFLKMALISFVALVSACGRVNSNELQSSSDVVGKNGQKYGFVANGKNALGVAYRERNGVAVVGGDILFPLERIKKTRDEALGLAQDATYNALWPGGVVPYELPANFEYGTEWAFMVAEWAKAGIQWVPRSGNEEHYVKVVIEFREGECGSSYLGRELYFSPQPFYLIPRDRSALCNMQRTILHEAAHALGFTHEHQRSDRDNHIKFPPGTDLLIERIRKYEGTKNLSQYDLNSITHYSTFNGLGMLTLDDKVINLTTALSSQDIEAARVLYNLPAPTPSPSPLPSPTPVEAEAICIIRSGAGEVLERESMLARAACLEQCSEKARSRDNIECKWNGDKVPEDEYRQSSGGVIKKRTTEREDEEQKKADAKKEKERKKEETKKEKERKKEEAKKEKERKKEEAKKEKERKKEEAKKEKERKKEEAKREKERKKEEAKKERERKKEEKERKKAAEKAENDRKKADKERMKAEEKKEKDRKKAAEKAEKDRKKAEEKAEKDRKKAESDRKKAEEKAEKERKKKEEKEKKDRKKN